MRRYASGFGAAVAVLLVPFVASVAGDAGAQPKPAASGSASAAKSKPPKVATSASGEGGGTPKLPPPSKAGPPPKPEELWVVGSTDDTLLQWEKRAVRDALAGGKFAIGSIVAIPQIADEARAGSARAALLRI